MARLLLDTHAALWWWAGFPDLSHNASDAIETASSVSVSAISALEIAIKYRIGKLDMIGDPSVHWRRLMDLHDFNQIPVTAELAIDAGLLPGVHRDPFDRIIAAQALAENMVLVTCDAVFPSFGCRVLW